LVARGRLKAASIAKSPRIRTAPLSCSNWNIRAKPTFKRPCPFNNGSNIAAKLGMLDSDQPSPGLMRFLLLDLPARLLKGLLLLLVFLTPVLGVWLASSLVAYTNGPTWLAVCSGVLLFPLLPIAWDLWGRKRRQQKPPMLTWGDRVILRTLLLNLIFLTCLLALRPQTSFLALSTRGDWMLEGRQGPQIAWVRRSLFQLANELEWLYLAVHQNPYKQYADTSTVRPTPQPTVPPSAPPTPHSKPSPQAQPQPQPLQQTLLPSLQRCGQRTLPSIRQLLTCLPAWKPALQRWRSTLPSRSTIPFSG
jgi:hypothetical protein